MCLNARSIVGKILDLQVIVSNFSPDVICISETWLHDNISNSVFCLNNYQIFRKDRDDGLNAHGGVLIAVKTEYNPVLIDNDSIHEVVFVNLRIKNKILKIIAAYRPPSQNSYQNELFVSFLNNRLSTANDYILVGDFNYPNIDWSSYTSNYAYDMHFVNFVNQNNLTQWINEPTRDNNILDLCISSNPNLVKNTVVHSTFSTSDHCYFSCEINVFPDENLSPIIYYNFKNANWEFIHLHLSAVNWQQMLENSNVHQMWYRFKNLLEYLIDTYVPRNTLYAQKETPWSNKHIEKITRKKKLLWRRYKSRPSEVRK